MVLRFLNFVHISWSTWFMKEVCKGCSYCRKGINVNAIEDYYVYYCDLRKQELELSNPEGWRIQQYDIGSREFTLPVDCPYILELTVK